MTLQPGIKQVVRAEKIVLLMSYRKEVINFIEELNTFRVDCLGPLMRYLQDVSVGKENW